MKIAIPTSDRTNIHERTGRAAYFAVATIEDLNMVNIEYRENPPHQHSKDGGHSHAALVKLISDCDLMLVKAIGQQLRDELDEAGIAYETTTSDTIGGAVRKYLSNR